MTVEEVEHEILDLHPGDHLCVVYDSEPSAQVAALLPFLARGLAAGERCVYITDDQSPADVARALQDHGVDVAHERRSGALVLLTREDWQQPGRFDIAHKSDQIRETIEGGRQAGFTGVRIAAEMTWTVGPHIDLEMLRLWEATVNALVTSDDPVRIVCNYNRKRMDPAAVEASLLTHPRVVLDSDVCTNLFYEAPLFLEGERSLLLPGAAPNSTDAAAVNRRVDWMISRLRWARTIEREREARLRAEVVAESEARAREQVEDLLRQTAEQAELLATVNRIVQIVSSELDLDRAVQGVTDAAREAAGAEFAAFFYNRGDDDGDRYELYTLSGADRAAFDSFPLPRATAIFAPTFRGEASIRLDDVRIDPGYGQSDPHRGMPPGHPPVRSYLAVPVVNRTREVLGGLFLGHSTPAVFTERDQSIIEAIASQTAIVIDNARLFEQARRAIEIREEFLGIASHELKTPMTVVKGYAMMLARKLRQGRLDPEDLAGAVEELVGASDRLERLVNDLLDTSRIQTERLEMHPEPVDLARVAATVARRFDGDPLLTPQHELVVDAPDPVIGLWDPSRIDQVLTNLVSNALKYSPGGGEVRVSVNEDGDQAVVRVQDHGIGIPPEDAPNLFQAFRRGAANERVLPGSGLGLYISAEIARRHGGCIELDEDTEVGSTFVVCLPLGQDEDLAAGGAAG